MADNVAITAGSGTTIAADDVGGVLHQRVKLSLGADGTANDASAGAGAVGTGTQRVTLASDDPAVATLGAAADAASTTTTIKAALRGIATALGITALDLGSGTGGSRTLRTFKDTAQWVGGSGVNGTAVQRMTVATDDTLVASLATKLDTLHSDAIPLGGGSTATSGRVTESIKPIHVAGTAMTRPANTTAYAANDSISDNGTAGSVTANSVTLSDTNDDPIALDEILLTSTDTGFGGKSIRIYLYNSNPTSSSGVVGGDNAAFSNKQAGFIGSFTGTMLTFSDGSRGRFVPENGSRVITTPTSGAKTIFWQLQSLDAATPSGNSTTFTPTFKGFQMRAA